MWRVLLSKCNVSYYMFQVPDICCTMYHPQLLITTLYCTQWFVRLVPFMWSLLTKTEKIKTEIELFIWPHKELHGQSSLWKWWIYLKKYLQCLEITLWHIAHKKATNAWMFLIVERTTMLESSYSPILPYNSSAYGKPTPDWGSQEHKLPGHSSFWEHSPRGAKQKCFSFSS